jgi:DNA-binding CsgD family transcriptional regulator
MAVCLNLTQSEACDAIVNAGAGQLIVLEAPAGAGKSWLIDQVRHHPGADRTIEVVSASAMSTEHPLHPFDRWLEEATRNDQHAELSDAVANSVLAAIEHHDEEPALLVVDDLHWADQATLRVIADIASRRATYNLSILLALRPGPHNGALSTFLDSLAGEVTHRVALRPLDAQAVTDLQTALIGAPPPPAVGALAQACGGNPLLVREVTQLVMELGVADIQAATNVDERVHATAVAVVLRRLERQPPETRSLLAMAALLGTVFELAELSAITERPLGRLLVELAPAIDARLISAGDQHARFSHDATREAAYSLLPSGVRGQLHAEAARQLVQANLSGARALEQRVAAATLGHADGVGHLVAAADAAMRSSIVVGIDLYQRALEMNPSPDAAVAIGRQLISAHLARGDLQSARRAADHALAHNPPASEAIDIQLMPLLHDSDYSFVMRQCDALLDNPQISVPQRALLHAHLANLAAIRLGNDQFWDHANAALELSGPANRPEAAALTQFACAFRAAAQGDTDASRTWTAAGVDTMRSQPPTSYSFVNAAFHHSYMLFHDDDFATAESVLRDDIAARERIGHHTWLYRNQCSLMSILYHGGRIDEAAALAQAIRMPDDRSPWTRAITTATIAAAHMWHGELAEAQRLRDEIEQSVSGAAPHTGMPETATLLALIAEASGDAAAAVKWHELLLTPGPASRFTTMWHINALELARLAPESAALTATVRPTASRNTNGRSPSTQGVIDLIHGIQQQQPELVDSAIEHFRSSPRRLLHLHALHAAATTAARWGDRTLADGWNRAGRALADQLRLPAAVTRFRSARADSTLPTRSGRSFGWGSLTATEQLVAEALSQRLTNREIADQMLVGYRTVESHVTAILRKSGLVNRAQVGAAWRERARSVVTTA